MSCRYVCSSCRKRLLQLQLRAAPKTTIRTRTPRYSTTSTSNEHPRQFSSARAETQPQEEDLTQPSGTSDAASLAQAYENLRTAEDDFLDRILQGHSSEYGPYSRPRIPAQRPFERPKRPSYNLRSIYSTRTVKNSEAANEKELQHRSIPNNSPSRTLALDNPQNPSLLEETPFSSLNYSSVAAENGSISLEKETTNPAEDWTGSPQTEVHGEEPPPLSDVAAICDPKNTSLQAWSLFLNFPAHEQHSKGQLLLGIEKPLMHKILQSWSSGALFGSELTPSIAFRELHRQGFSPGVMGWRKMAMYAVKASILHLGKGRPNPEAPLDPRTACLELNNIWNLAVELNGPPNSDPGSKLLKEMESFSTTKSSQESFRRRFKTNFPSDLVRRSQSGELLFIATYHILSDRCQRLDALIHEVRQYQPFLKYAGQLFTSYGWISAKYLRDFLLSVEGIPASCAHRLYDAQMAYQKLSKVGNVVETRTRSETRPIRPTSKKSAEDFDVTLKKAVKSSDIAHVEDLWNQAERLAAEAELSLSHHLYVQFITAFSSLRRPNRAVDVWNAMVQAGFIPRLSVWDSMLRGFGSVRDRDGVERIWNMLKQSGSGLDSRVWAARIWSLSSSADKAMSAFEEMMNDWLIEVKRTRKGSNVTAADLTKLGDINGVPKPTVEVLNATVLSAAMKLNGLSRLEKLLSWSKALGIQPDIYTFNSIIRGAAKRGNTEMITMALNHMQRLGIEVDITTFTMLLQSCFRAMSPPTVENESEQEEPTYTASDKLEICARILDEIDRTGLQANAYTYSIIISSLLKSSPSDPLGLEAATAVINYMRTKGIPLSSQIYTSLVTAYFDRERADAVIQTWKEARKDDAALLDEIFYDRLIEGFAKQDDTRRMRIAMIEAGRANRVIGWIALTEAVNAHVRASEMDSVREIIEQVKKEEQLTDRMRKGKGQKWFWDTIRALGFHIDGLSGSDREVDT